MPINNQEVKPYKKAIDNISINNARTIYKVIMLYDDKGLTDTEVKTRVRAYLRMVKQTPTEAINKHVEKNTTGRHIPADQRKMPRTPQDCTFPVHKPAIHTGYGIDGIDPCKK